MCCPGRVLASHPLADGTPTWLTPAPALKEDISKKQAHGWGSSMEGGPAGLCRSGPGPVRRVSGLVPGGSESLRLGRLSLCRQLRAPALPQCALSLPGHGICLRGRGPH